MKIGGKAWRSCEFTGQDGVAYSKSFARACRAGAPCPTAASLSGVPRIDSRTVPWYDFTDTPTGMEAIAVRQCMDAENLHRRLKKIIGQVQAIDRMVDEDVPCEDILAQINAAKAALHGCGKVVLEGHIDHCVRDGILHGDPDKTIESFTKAVERFANMG